MKYYWFGKADEAQLRNMGANHLFPTEFSYFGVLIKSEKRARQFIFQAADGVDLIFKIVTNFTPIEITEKQYKRISKNQSVRLSDAAIDEIRRILYTPDK